MLLKVVTTVCLVVGFATLLALPSLISSRPVHKGRTRAEVRAYASRLGAASAVLTVAFAGSGVGALLILRAMRREYRELAARNAEALTRKIVEEPREGA